MSQRLLPFDARRSECSQENKTWRGLDDDSYSSPAEGARSHQQVCSMKKTSTKMNQHQHSKKRLVPSDTSGDDSIKEYKKSEKWWEVLEEGSFPSLKDSETESSLRDRKSYMSQRTSSSGFSCSDFSVGSKEASRMIPMKEGKKVFVSPRQYSLAVSNETTVAFERTLHRSSDPNSSSFKVDSSLEEVSRSEHAENINPLFNRQTKRKMEHGGKFSRVLSDMTHLVSHTSVSDSVYEQVEKSNGGVIGEVACEIYKSEQYEGPATATYCRQTVERNGATTTYVTISEVKERVQVQNRSCRVPSKKKNSPFDMSEAVTDLSYNSDCMFVQHMSSPNRQSSCYMLSGSGERDRKQQDTSGVEVLIETQNPTESFSDVEVEDISDLLNRSGPIEEKKSRMRRVKSESKQLLAICASEFEDVLDKQTTNCGRSPPSSPNKGKQTSSFSGGFEKSGKKKSVRNIKKKSCGKDFTQEQGEKTMDTNSSGSLGENTKLDIPDYPYFVNKRKRRNMEQNMLINSGVFTDAFDCESTSVSHCSSGKKYSNTSGSSNNSEVNVSRRSRKSLSFTKKMVFANVDEASESDSVESIAKGFQQKNAGLKIDSGEIEDLSTSPAFQRKKRKTLLSISSNTFNEALNSDAEQGDQRIHNTDDNSIIEPMENDLSSGNGIKKGDRNGHLPLEDDVPGLAEYPTSGKKVLRSGKKRGSRSSSSRTSSLSIKSSELNDKHFSPILGKNRRSYKEVSINSSQFVEALVSDEKSNTSSNKSSSIRHSVEEQFSLGSNVGSKRCENDRSQSLNEISSFEIDETHAPCKNPLFERKKRKKLVPSQDSAQVDHVLDPETMSERDDSQEICYKEREEDKGERKSLLRRSLRSQNDGVCDLFNDSRNIKRPGTSGKNKMPTKRQADRESESPLLAPDILNEIVASPIIKRRTGNKSTLSINLTEFTDALNPEKKTNSDDHCVNTCGTNLFPEKDSGDQGIEMGCINDTARRKKTGLAIPLGEGEVSGRQISIDRTDESGSFDVDINLDVDGMSKLTSLCKKKGKKSCVSVHSDEFAEAIEDEKSNTPCSRTHISDGEDNTKEEKMKHSVENGVHVRTNEEQHTTRDESHSLNEVSLVSDVSTTDLSPLVRRKKKKKYYVRNDFKVFDDAISHNGHLNDEKNSSDKISSLGTDGTKESRDVQNGVVQIAASSDDALEEEKNKEKRGNERESISSGLVISVCENETKPISGKEADTNLGSAKMSKRSDSSIVSNDVSVAAGMKSSIDNTALPVFQRGKGKKVPVAINSSIFAGALGSSVDSDSCSAIFPSEFIADDQETECEKSNTGIKTSASVGEGAQSSGQPESPVISKGSKAVSCVDKVYPIHGKADEDKSTNVCKTDEFSEGSSKKSKIKDSLEGTSNRDSMSTGIKNSFENPAVPVFQRNKGKKVPVPINSSVFAGALGSSVDSDSCSAIFPSESMADGQENDCEKGNAGINTSASVSGGAQSSGQPESPVISKGSKVVSCADEVHSIHGKADEEKSTYVCKTDEVAEGSGKKSNRKVTLEGSSNRDSMPTGIKSSFENPVVPVFQRSKGKKVPVPINSSVFAGALGSSVDSDSCSIFPSESMADGQENDCEKGNTGIKTSASVSGGAQSSGQPESPVISKGSKAVSCADEVHSIHGKADEEKSTNVCRTDEVAEGSGKKSESKVTLEGSSNHESMPAGMKISFENPAVPVFQRNKGKKVPVPVNSSVFAGALGSSVDSGSCSAIFPSESMADGQENDCEKGNAGINTSASVSGGAQSSGQPESPVINKGRKAVSCADEVHSIHGKADEEKSTNVCKTDEVAEGSGKKSKSKVTLEGSSNRESMPAGMKISFENPAVPVFQRNKGKKAPLIINSSAFAGVLGTDLHSDSSSVNCLHESMPGSHKKACKKDSASGITATPVETKPPSKGLSESPVTSKGGSGVNSSEEKANEISKKVEDNPKVPVFLRDRAKKAPLPINSNVFAGVLSADQESDCSSATCPSESLVVEKEDDSLLPDSEFFQLNVEGGYFESTRGYIVLDAKSPFSRINKDFGDVSCILTESTTEKNPLQKVESPTTNSSQKKGSSPREAKRGNVGNKVNQPSSPVACAEKEGPPCSQTLIATPHEETDIPKHASTERILSAESSRNVVVMPSSNVLCSQREGVSPSVKLLPKPFETAEVLPPVLGGRNMRRSAENEALQLSIGASSSQKGGIHSPREPLPKSPAAIHSLEVVSTNRNLKEGIEVNEYLQPSLVHANAERAGLSSTNKTLTKPPSLLHVPMQESTSENLRRVDEALHPSSSTSSSQTGGISSPCEPLPKSPAAIHSLEVVLTNRNLKEDIEINENLQPSLVHANAERAGLSSPNKTLTKPPSLLHVPMQESTSENLRRVDEALHPSSSTSSSQNGGISSPCEPLPESPAAIHSLEVVLTNRNLKEGIEINENLQPSLVHANAERAGLSSPNKILTKPPSVLHVPMQESTSENLRRVSEALQPSSSVSSSQKGGIHSPSEPLPKPPEMIHSLEVVLASRNLKEGIEVDENLQPALVHPKIERAGLSSPNKILIKPHSVLHVPKEESTGETLRSVSEALQPSSVVPSTRKEGSSSPKQVLPKLPDSIHVPKQVCTGRNSKWASVRTVSGIPIPVASMGAKKGAVCTDNVVPSKPIMCSIARDTNLPSSAVALHTEKRKSSSNSSKRNVVSKENLVPPSGEEKNNPLSMESLPTITNSLTTRKNSSSLGQVASLENRSPVKSDDCKLLHNYPEGLVSEMPAVNYVTFVKAVSDISQEKSSINNQTFTIADSKSVPGVPPAQISCDINNLTFVKSSSAFEHIITPVTEESSSAVLALKSESVRAEVVPDETMEDMTLSNQVSDLEIKRLVPVSFGKDYSLQVLLENVHKDSFQELSAKESHLSVQTETLPLKLESSAVDPESLNFPAELGKSLTDRETLMPQSELLDVHPECANISHSSIESFIQTGPDSRMSIHVTEVSMEKIEAISDLIAMEISMEKDPAAQTSERIVGGSDQIADDVSLAKHDVGGRQEALVQISQSESLKASPGAVNSLTLPVSVNASLKITCSDPPEEINSVSTLQYDPEPNHECAIEENIKNEQFKSQIDTSSLQNLPPELVATSSGNLTEGIVATSDALPAISPVNHSPREDTQEKLSLVKDTSGSKMGNFSSSTRIVGKVSGLSGSSPVHHSSREDTQVKLSLVEDTSRSKLGNFSSSTRIVEKVSGLSGSLATMSASSKSRPSNSHIVSLKYSNLSFDSELLMLSPLNLKLQSSESSGPSTSSSAIYSGQFTESEFSGKVPEVTSNSKCQQLEQSLCLRDFTQSQNSGQMSGAKHSMDSFSVDKRETSAVHPEDLGHSGNHRSSGPIFSEEQSGEVQSEASCGRDSLSYRESQEAASNAKGTYVTSMKMSRFWNTSHGEESGPVLVASNGGGSLVSHPNERPGVNQSVSSPDTQVSGPITIMGRASLGQSEGNFSSSMGEDSMSHPGERLSEESHRKGKLIKSCDAKMSGVSSCNEESAQSCSSQTKDETSASTVKDIKKGDDSNSTNSEDNISKIVDNVLKKLDDACSLQRQRELKQAQLTVQKLKSMLPSTLYPSNPKKKLESCARGQPRNSCRRQGSGDQVARKRRLPAWFYRQFKKVMVEAMEKMEMNYLDQEEFLFSFTDLVKLVMRSKNHDEVKDGVISVQKQLFNLKIVRTLSEFFQFVRTYMPYEFRCRSIPCSGWDDPIYATWVDDSDLNKPLF